MEIAHADQMNMQTVGTVKNVSLAPMCSSAVNSVRSLMT